MPESPPRQASTWNQLLQEAAPLLLPVSHDAPSSRLIERAGFKAYQVGGFAVIGARYGLPDIDLTHFAEKTGLVESIMAASSLPVLVDCDDGYGDGKNVTHTVRSFARLGVAAIFIEDQQAPKKCGHMSGKKVIPPDEMVLKVKAAVAAREHGAPFVIARTDAVEPNGLNDALKRAEQYLKAGADGIYVEGLEDEKALTKVGEAFKGTPLATTILERGGKTPWQAPADFHAMGYTMLLYPTTVIFRATWAIQSALRDLKAGKPLDPGTSVDMAEFEDIVDLPYWADIEKRFTKQ
ncbi:MAG TPA: isocitrate lyase/PEP mutase family protein [Dongiaceae bacterium]|jgi:methylisocitrate lyase|nr:isocitrate lyase/PEP mutase family protein [Dongiaceae bacterium]